MQNKSARNAILILLGFAAVTLGAYRLAHLLLYPGPSEPVSTFSTTYDTATAIPLPAFEPKIAGTLAGRIHSFAVSPDLKTIAIATTKGRVLYDLKSYERIRILGENENSFSAAWSPDGKRLAIGSLVMQNSESGKPHLVVRETSAWKIPSEPKIGNGDTTMFFGALAWSFDGNFLATSDYDRGLITFDIKTGDPVSLQEDFLISPDDISWSPDGSRLIATGDLGYGFRRWRVDNDKSVRLYDQRVDRTMQLAWSPDGKRIASGQQKPINATGLSRHTKIL